MSIQDTPTAHRRHLVQVEEDVGALRRAVRTQAAGLPGLPEGVAELIATELASNILRHTPGGYVLVRRTSSGIELVAVDHGPGLPVAVRQRLAAPAESEAPAWPVSDHGGLGVGLATVRRRATLLDWYSTRDGTVILVCLENVARGARSGAWRWGGVNVPLGGHGASGDAWAVAVGSRLAAVLVDGLGHGQDAAIAAHAAITEFQRQYGTDDTAGLDPETSLTTYAARAHRAMRGTRGGVLGACVLDPATDRAVFAGIGNIAARIWNPRRSQHLVSHPGTLGTELAPPRARPATYPWPPGSILLLASDGVSTRWNLDSGADLLGHHPTTIAAVIHRDHTRATDDAAILVVADDRDAPAGQEATR